MSSILGAVGTFFGGPIGGAIGGAAGSLFEGRRAGRAERGAAGAQERGAELGIGEIRRFTEQGIGGFQPFLGAGTGALEQQQRLLGLLGPEQQESAFGAFRQSPGQQFLQERGQRSLLRGASAIGGIGGGRVREALVQQGVGFAQQDFGNFFNRLQGLAGGGLQAAGGIGRLAAGAGRSIAGLFGTRGQARASGILGAQQAEARTSENITGLFSQAGLFDTP